MSAMGRAGLKTVQRLLLKSREDMMMNGTTVLAVGMVGSGLLEYVLEVEKAKKAGEILSEKKYRQHPEKLKFTYAMDTMEQALNKSNKLIMDKVRTHLLVSASELLQCSSH